MTLEINGWTMDYKCIFTASYEEQTISGIVMCTWTRHNLKIGQSIRCHEVDGQ